MIVTMEWLGRYLAIKEEIKDIKARLDAMDGWKSPRLSDNPSHTSSTEGLDPIIIRREKLYRKYLEKLAEGQGVILEIETFVEEVADPLARTIIRMKYIDGMTWREAGDLLHLDYSACHRRVEGALSNNNKNNKGL